MRRRILTLILALAIPAEVQAHRLEAECRFLPGRMVRVETWFDNGQTPKSGEVEVSDSGGQVLVKGQLSSQGLFLFDAPEGQPLKVVVEAGEGHRAEVAIKPGEVLLAQAPEKAAPTSNPTAIHEATFPVKDMLLGIGLLIAVAAFVLSLRNARALRELRRAEERRPEGGR